MKIQKMKIPAILGALLLAGTLSAGAQMNSDSLYKEPYRPQYHFSPEKGWIGDPSGFMFDINTGNYPHLCFSRK